MVSKPKAPCRLFVYLASSAAVAVVLRRGPSDWARLSLWHTDSDRIEDGQWIKGRVYERRCDLSPDGRLFAAFIRQNGGSPGISPDVDSWLAVSRPPLFTALSVWFVGGTYYTGGYFPDPSSLWIGFMEKPPDVGSLPPWLKTVGPKEIPYIDGTSEWTDRTVHFNRLLRDGWQLRTDEGSRTTWLKESKGRQLIMDHVFEGFNRYGGPYAVRYSLRLLNGNEVDLGPAAWADWDQQGRLVLARDGKLMHVGDDLGQSLIHDFNGQTPALLSPPKEAAQWPEAPSLNLDASPRLATD